MVNPYYRLFNFIGAPLTRYRWRNQDFGDLQDNGLVAMIEGLMQGSFNGAVLQGLGLQSCTGLNFTVASGFAVGPSGDLMYLPQAVTGTFASPTAAWGARNLCVIRPLLSTPASGIITPPTVPLTSAALFFDHYAQVVAIDGSSASGAAPATGANDVILFGVRLAQNASSFTPSGAAEYVSRDVPGRRNGFAEGHLLSTAVMWDARCRPYASGANSIGIKPSQNLRGGLFYPGYNGITTASIFPKSSGSYNGGAGDTFLNFTTGVVTGADATTAAFTPQIPTANNFKWALVALTSSDTLVVTFGTTGTYLQCLTAFRNQVSSGAGAIPVSANFKLAYVLLGSYNGTTITELDVYDARGINQVPGIATTLLKVVRVNAAASPYTVLATDDVIEIDTDGDIVLNFPDRASNQGKRYEVQRVNDVDNTHINHSVTINRAGADTFVGGGTTYLLDSAYQAQVFIAGTTSWLVDDEGD